MDYTTNEEPKSIDTGKWWRWKKDWKRWKREDHKENHEWLEENRWIDKEWRKEWKGAEKGWEAWKGEPKINEGKDDITKVKEDWQGKEEPKSYHEQNHAWEEERIWKPKDQWDKPGDEGCEWLGEAKEVEIQMEPQDLRNGDQEDMDEPQEDREMDQVQV